MSATKTKRSSHVRSRMAPDERIGEIIAATRKLLDEKGYEKLLTTEVAERCRISEATIYKYFETKRELLTRVAEQWFAELIERPEVATRKRSIHARLRQSIWESLDVVRRSPSISRYIMMELRPDPAYRSMRIYEQNKQYTNKIIALLEEAVASGEFRADVSVLLLRNVVFGAIEHQTWAYMRGEGDFDVDAAANGIADIVYRGMAATPQRAALAQRRIASWAKTPAANKRVAGAPRARSSGAATGARAKTRGR